MKKTGEAPNSGGIRWKPSLYNHFLQGDEGLILAYNALSNSFARITPEKYAIIKEILSAPNQNSNDAAEIDTLKNDLIRGGFLVDSCLLETEVMLAQDYIHRFANRTLSITAAPTLNCNCRCDYCFEEKKDITMTPEVEEAVVKFVEAKLKDLKVINTCWFGGEPLLKIDIIERLMNTFMELSQKNDAVCQPASIITNGYLLTEELAVRLKKANIVSAQVTLDGPPEIHDKRRKLPNGKGTFHTILENIKKAANVINIYVRINIDKDNATQLKQFFQMWFNEEISRKIPFYFGRVISNTNACSDISGRCYSTKEFSELIVEKYQEAKEYGLINVMYPFFQKGGHCLADNLNGFVIAPNGLLFKCWEEISDGIERSIGSLLTEKKEAYQIMNTVKYLNWNPLSQEQCKSCDIFPVCKGGCIYAGLHQTDQKQCSSWKYNLHEMLRLKYDTQKNRNVPGG